VFVRSANTLHRRITNFSEIEGFWPREGFSVFFPEQSLREQIRSLRESGNVVSQSGSGALALLLGRPGPKGLRPIDTLVHFAHRHHEMAGIERLVRNEKMR